MSLAGLVLISGIAPQAYAQSPVQLNTASNTIISAQSLNNRQIATQRNNDGLVGGVVGATAGGLIGSQIAGRNARGEGAIIGALIGGITGFSIADNASKSRVDSFQSKRFSSRQFGQTSIDYDPYYDSRFGNSGHGFSTLHGLGGFRGRGFRSRGFNTPGFISRRF